MPVDFENEKRSAMEAVADAWNREGLTYSVAHGVEQYPKIGRDLDVIFTPTTLIPARDIAIHTLVHSGWKIAFAYREWAWWIFAFKQTNDGAIAIEIDLLPCLQSGFTRVVCDPATAQYRFQAGPFWSDPWASVAKRIVLQTFSGNFSRFAKRPWELALTTKESRVFRNNLLRLTGRAAKPYIAAVEAGDIPKMKATVANVKKGMLIRAMIHPVNFLSKMRFAVKRVFMLNIGTSRAVPIIALVGPDGVGKTTVIQELSKLIANELVFPSVIIRHWRPTLLPDLSDLVHLRFRKSADEVPVPTPPRRHAGRGSWFRAMYYSIDYLLGHLFLDCRESVRLNVILYDRHAVDMVVNPVRYGFQHMPRWLFRLLPKPDYIVALVDTPERIISRKAELSEDEIRTQIKKWDELYRERAIHEIIVVNTSAKNVARKIFNSVVDQFCACNPPPSPTNSGYTRSTV